jgi:hypothetical protein
MEGEELEDMAARLRALGGMPLASISTVPLGLRAGQTIITIPEIEQKNDDNRDSIPAQDGWLRDQKGKPVPGQELLPPLNPKFLEDWFARETLLAENPDYEFFQILSGRLNGDVSLLVDLDSMYQTRMAYERQTRQLAEAEEQRQKNVDKRHDALSNARLERDRLEAQRNTQRNAVALPLERLLYVEGIANWLEIAPRPGDSEAIPGLLWPFWRKWEYTWASKLLAGALSAPDVATFDFILDVDKRVHGGTAPLRPTGTWTEQTVHKYIAARDIEQYIIPGKGYHPDQLGWKGGQMAIAVGALESLITQAAISALEHLPGSSPSDARVLAARADVNFSTAAAPLYGQPILFPWFEKWCQPFSACPLLASKDIAPPGGPPLPPLEERNLAKLEAKLHYGATSAAMPAMTDWNQLRRDHLAGVAKPGFDRVVLHNKMPSGPALATSYLFDHRGDHSNSRGMSLEGYVFYRHHFPTILDYEWACEAIESLLGPYLYRVLDALFPLRPPAGTDIGFLNALRSRLSTLDGAPREFRAAAGGSRLLPADTDRVRFLYTTLVPDAPVLAGDQLRYVQENEDALRSRTGTTVWRLGLANSVAEKIPRLPTDTTFGEFVAEEWNPNRVAWDSASDKQESLDQNQWPEVFAQTPYASNPHTIISVVLPALVGDTLVKATKGLLHALQVWSLSLCTCLK